LWAVPACVAEASRDKGCLCQALALRPGFSSGSPIWRPLTLYFSTVVAEPAAQRVQLIARSAQYRVNLCNGTAATECNTDDLNNAIKQADALAKSLASAPPVPTPNHEKVNAFSVPALGEEWG
jgi:hypothetical protein